MIIVPFVAAHTVNLPLPRLGDDPSCHVSATVNPGAAGGGPGGGGGFRPIHRHHSLLKDIPFLKSIPEAASGCWPGCWPGSWPDSAASRSVSDSEPLQPENSGGPRAAPADRAPSARHDADGKAVPFTPRPGPAPGGPTSESGCARPTSSTAARRRGPGNPNHRRISDCFRAVISI